MARRPRRALAAGGTSIPSLRTDVEHLSGGQRQAIELNRFVHGAASSSCSTSPSRRSASSRPGGASRRRPGARRGIGVIIITHVMAQAFAGRRPHRRDAPGTSPVTCSTEATSPDEVVG